MFVFNQRSLRAFNEKHSFIIKACDDYGGVDVDLWHLLLDLSDCCRCLFKLCNWLYVSGMWFLFYL